MIDWVEWNGGVGPLSRGDLFDLKFRDGSYACGVFHGAYCWQHSGAISDIVAYRTHKAISGGAKNTNPKDAIGSSKLPLHLWPTTASAMGCIGLLNGALKYGRTNWRHAGVRASIYYDACRRHLDAWFEGEECDPDDGVPHLAAALACIAIIVDASAAGKLNDDRAMPAGYRNMVTDLTTHVERLKALHAGKDPKHYTIQDGAKSA